MHSWLTRCSIGLSSVAVLGALLLPATAQAAGTDIVVSSPNAPAATADSTTAPVSEEVEVEQTPIEVEPAAQDSEPEVQRTEVDPFRMAGVTWDADSDVRDVTVRVQVRTNGTWGDWQDLEIESAIEGGRPGTAPLWTSDPADAIAVEVKSASGAPSDVKVTTIDPGKAEVVTPVRNAAYTISNEDAPLEQDDSSTESAAADGTPSVVPMPSIITRAQWRAGAGTSCSAPVTRPKALGVVIHHTAGSNTYTKAESAGIVRSYQTYHVKGHGWCDIGYNFLVDRFGQIFEGRKGGMTNQVRAAHSGVDAVNQYATGVSMLGHFDYVKPSAAMQSAVVRLVGWRLKYFGANPKGTYSAGGRTYKVINGHRDVKSTACPGKYAYAWLSQVGGLRDRAATYISKASKAAGAPNASTTLAAPTNVKTSARPTAINASWKGVAGAPGYRILVSPTGSTANALYYRTTGRSFTVPNLTARRTYVVRVAAYDAAKKQRLGRWSAVAPGTARTPAFAPVSGVTASRRAVKGLRITWRAQVGAPGYRVQLVPTAGGKARYVQTSTNEAGFGGLTKGTHYRVRVAVVYPTTKERVSAYTAQPHPILATKGVAASTPSAPTPAPAAPKFVAPTGVKVTKRAVKGLRFSWRAQAGAPGYRVQVLPVATGKPKRYIQTTTNSVGVGGLTKGTVYQIRVAVVRPSTKERLSPYTKAPFPTAATMGVGASPTPPPSARNTVTPKSGAVTFKGHGYGHGIGMSQYGAEGGARDGKKYGAILGRYYAGTKLANKSATIRVLLSSDTTDSVRVKHKSGLKLRTLGTNKTLALPASPDGRKASDWSIDPAASNKARNALSYKSGSKWYVYRSFPADAQFEGPTSISLVMPSGSTQAFRGALRSTKPTSTSRDTVNVLSLEDYTRGVVAREMPSSWSLEALKAQSVAARTFGSRYLGSTRHYDICDTTSCQVYGGVSAETSRTNQAIDGTRGKILTYNGAPALTQFSSSSGGYTNVGSEPYLKAIADPWDNWSGNKNHAWSQKVTSATIQSKYPIGTLRSITITRRNGLGDQGGRVVSMILKGSKGSRTISGVDARWAFGLKSDWFGF